MTLINDLNVKLRQRGFLGGIGSFFKSVGNATGTVGTSIIARIKFEQVKVLNDVVINQAENMVKNAKKSDKQFFDKNLVSDLANIGSSIVDIVLVPAYWAKKWWPRW